MIEFKEPPARKSPGRAFDPAITAEIEQLQAHPGKWALVREGAWSAGTASTYRKRGCQIRTVKRDDNRFDIYARWQA